MIKRTKDRLLSIFIFTLFVAGCDPSSTSPNISPTDEQNPIPGATDLSVRQENASWVNECLGRIPLHKTKNVDSFMWELCQAPNLYLGNPTKFILGRTANKLTLQYKIHFLIRPQSVSNSQALQMLTRAKNCIPQIQNVWSRYGVTMNVTLDSDIHPQNSNLPTQEVLLTFGEGRANSGNFYSGAWNYSNDYEQDRLCRTMVHEVGHHIGLEDEYADDYCVDRPFVSQEKNPYSIMANIWGMGWNDFDFYSRHLRTVFQDFCLQSNSFAAESAISDEDKILIGFPE